MYLDNAHAKKTLQEMMDRALFGASQQFQQSSRRAIMAENQAMNGHPPQGVEASAKRARLDMDQPQRGGGQGPGKRLDFNVGRVINPFAQRRASRGEPEQQTGAD